MKRNKRQGKATLDRSHNTEAGENLSLLQHTHTHDAHLLTNITDGEDRSI